MLSLHASTVPSVPASGKVFTVIAALPETVPEQLLASVTETNVYVVVTVGETFIAVPLV